MLTILRGGPYRFYFYYEVLHGNGSNEIPWYLRAVLLFCP